MNGASKILTVSYGTFSCTLEGFDDPFNTMKAIAEYFRDLAADDRYFGAEPPTPDAAMLHRIAEREIQRRVEAKVGEHGVVLRAGEAQAPQVAAPAPTVAPQPAPEPVAAAAPVIEAPALQTPPAPQPAPQPTLATPAEAAPAVESAAARLSRLRAAQAQLQTVAPAAAPVAAAPAPVARADAEAYVEDQEAAAPIPEIAEAALPEPAPVIAEAVQPQIVIEEAVQAEPEMEAPVERVLAALQETPAEEAAEEVAEEVLADDAPVLASLRETLSGLMEQDEQLAEDMAADMAEAEVAPISAAFPEDMLPEDEVEAMPPLAEEVAEVAMDEAFDVIAEVEEAEIVATEAPIIDDAAYIDAEEPVAASAELAMAEEATAPEASDASLAAALAEEVQPDIAVSEAAPITAEKLQRARARVIKIRRLDKKAKPVEALSPEDEADLQNTLAALEAETKPAATAPVSEPEPVVEVEAEPETPAENPLAVKADAAVDRLLAEANQQLEVPEVKRRRSAIAHLKAAVLATVADRRANPKARALETEAKADPYRQDLDKVVRPSATGERPAPLVLVSEQRIYRKSDAAADPNRPVPTIVSSTPQPAQAVPGLPVRPRRVTSGSLAQAVTPDFEDETEFSAADDLSIPQNGTKQSFAEFAETLGANSLAELLEAAGAYCTLVLDRPSFSRPQLFAQISQMPQMAETKREDSLRDFGKLLREGRFHKTVRGQFALAETSPILTEAKRLAG